MQCKLHILSTSKQLDFLLVFLEAVSAWVVMALFVINTDQTMYVCDEFYLVTLDIITGPLHTCSDTFQSVKVNTI